MNVADEITQFISHELGSTRHIGSLGPTDNLLAEGIVDSVAIVKLVHFLEERFSIRVADEDVVPENFQDIVSLSRFVHVRLG